MTGTDNGLSVTIRLLTLGAVSFYLALAVLSCRGENNKAVSRNSRNEKAEKIEVK